MPIGEIGKGAARVPIKHPALGRTMGGLPEACPHPRERAADVKIARGRPDDSTARGPGLPLGIVREITVQCFSRNITRSVMSTAKT